MNIENLKIIGISQSDSKAYKLRNSFIDYFSIIGFEGIPSSDDGFFPIEKDRLDLVFGEQEVYDLNSPEEKTYALDYFSAMPDEISLFGGNTRKLLKDTKSHILLPDSILETGVDSLVSAIQKMYVSDAALNSATGSSVTNSLIVFDELFDFAINDKKRYFNHLKDRLESSDKVPENIFFIAKYDL